MKKWLVRGIAAVALFAAALVIGGAVNAISRVPDLEPWHRLTTTLEARASDLPETATLDDLLRREEAVFREVSERVDSVVSAGADASIPNRFVTGSRSHPSRFDTNWNRTQILDTPAPRAGALLVHGLTDSPYSMRAIAARLHERGIYTLSLRMQGHGTVPGGLVHPRWEDWSAAVRVGVRHLRQRIGPERPLVLVGYSNGGALAVKYALDAVEDSQLPAVSNVILVSPMIGVSPMARFARAISALGPVVHKAHWLDVFPEYNPFKYISVPANAGVQTWRLTRAIAEQLARLAGAGHLDRFPAILAFQSVVDTTVSTPAVIYELFDRLPAGGRHELVLFDLNRQSRVDVFTHPGAVLPRLLDDGPRAYGVTLVTNTSNEDDGVSAITAPPNATALVRLPLDLRWPAEMFSLSHVALPFAGEDPLYGGLAAPGPAVALGRLTPRGEKGVLIVPVESLMRVTWNPFFAYLAERIDRVTAF
jgi:alpha-beta hydrolase superfamily lysophospholipase